MYCDSKRPNTVDSEGFSEETADNIEKNHVFHVYDEIAGISKLFPILYWAKVC